MVFKESFSGFKGILKKSRGIPEKFQKCSQVLWVFQGRLSGVPREFKGI